MTPGKVKRRWRRMETGIACIGEGVSVGDGGAVWQGLTTFAAHAWTTDGYRPPARYTTERAAKRAVERWLAGRPSKKSRGGNG